MPYSVSPQLKAATACQPDRCRSRGRTSRTSRRRAWPPESGPARGRRSPNPRPTADHQNGEPSAGSRNQCHSGRSGANPTRYLLASPAIELRSSSSSVGSGRNHDVPKRCGRPAQSRRKPMPPAKKPATAASLAALSTAPAVPPAARRLPAPVSSAGNRSRSGGSNSSCNGSRPIQPRRDPSRPLGPGQGILDRQLHVRRAQLGHHRAVDEFYQRMDDRLRMDHHVDLLGPQVEQPAGLDDLQGLVHHRGRIDRDLRPHVPGGMGQGVGHGDARPTAPRCTLRNGPPLAVSTTRRTSSRLPGLQGLKHRAVLAVDRQQDRRPVSAGQLASPAARPSPGFLCWPGRRVLPASKRGPACSRSPALPTIAATTTSTSGRRPTCCQRPRLPERAVHVPGGRLGPVTAGRLGSSVATTSGAELVRPARPAVGRLRVGRQSHGPQPPARGGDHLQRAAADAAGRAEHGDVASQGLPRGNGSSRIATMPGPTETAAGCMTVIRAFIGVCGRILSLVGGPDNPASPTPAAGPAMCIIRSTWLGPPGSAIQRPSRRAFGSPPWESSLAPSLL